MLLPMTRSLLTRCAVLALGTALAVGGLAIPARADANAPVVLIVMENHSYGPADPGVNGSTGKYVVGNTSDAPYLNDTLIPSGTFFTNYDASYQSSLPNYLMLTGGTNGGCPIAPCATDSIPKENLFHLLGQAGVPFASLQESMPANCKLTNSGYYLIGHNPEIYYTDVDARTGSPYDCPNTDLTIPAAAPGTPAAWPDPLPAFSFIKPNYCDDMHGSNATGACPKGTDQIIAAGDTWLGANVPALLSEGAIVIVTFDEGTGGDTTGGGGHVATIMAGPGVTPGASDATPYNHLSLLAGLQDYFGLSPLLGGAATATPLMIPRSTPYPTPAILGLTPESGKVGDQVTIAGSDLTNAYQVSFAGTLASFVVNSDTSITATVPGGAASGALDVSTIGGVATSPDTFDVTGVPPPPAVVQHAVATGANATQASASWPQGSAPGDLLVATVGWRGSGTPTPPPGWSVAVSSAGTAIYYQQNAPPVSGLVTFSFSAKVSWVLSLSEWSGVATSGALNQTAHATSGLTSGTTASSGTTKVTAQPVELALAAVRAVASVTESAPTHGFALLDLGVATNDTMGVYELVTTAAGTQSTSVSLSAPAKWRGVIATFRGA
jgi:phosphatidylinositol-3-phosphatase